MKYLVLTPRGSNSVVHILRRYERRDLGLELGQYAEAKIVAVTYCGTLSDSYDEYDEIPAELKQCRACSTDDIYVESEGRVVTQKEFASRGKEVLSKWRTMNRPN